MRGIGECTIAGKSFVLRELTAPQIIEELHRLDDPGEPHELDWLLAEKYMPVAAINKIAGEDVGAFWAGSDLAVSEIEPLFKKAVEVNPFLAGGLRKKIETVEALALSRSDAMLKDLSKIFDEVSSSSQTGDTPEQESTAGHTTSKP